MFMVKKMVDWDTRVYREKDEETDNYIVEDWMCNEYEMTWADSILDLLCHVNISMDADTEIIVIPVDEVLDCPLNEGFLYY